MRSNLTIAILCLLAVSACKKGALNLLKDSGSSDSAKQSCDAKVPLMPKQTLVKSTALASTVDQYKVTFEGEFCLPVKEEVISKPLRVLMILDFSPSMLDA